MNLYKEIIEKILSEVDPDIRELMLKEEVRQQAVYKGYDMLPDPANTILQWQSLRNKNGKRTDN